MKPAWVGAAEFAGLRPDDEQISRMETYRGWLATEGRRAGGIGPAETDRLDRRHLADSILFASQLPEVPVEVWDLGSGVGLPGIPLAICLPETRFVLVDRSGRRTNLMKRALRILEVRNCEVWQADIDDLTGEVGTIVSRAGLLPAQLRSVAETHLAPGGVAVMAGSWREPPDHPGWTTVEIPSHVLDQTVWLLIMRRE